MERKVGRAQLESEDESSIPSSPDAEQIRNLRQFEFVETHEPQSKPQSEVLENGELEFVLFAPDIANDKASETITKIRIQTPPLAEGDPGFTVPHRHSNYYFTQIPTPATRERFKASAVSGHEILARSNSLWPGSTYDWKVTHIPVTKRERSLLSAHSTTYAKLTGANIEVKRKRPGKQSRLKVRVKTAAAKAQQAQKQQDAELKEAAEREKRTRRNREKKVKRKQRDKAKTLEAKDEQPAAELD